MYNMNKIKYTFLCITSIYRVHKNVYNGLTRSHKQPNKEDTTMTLEKLFEMTLINDDTEIFIRDNDFNVLAHGNWYQDNVLDFLDAKIESFTWQDDDKIYIDIN